MYTILSSGFLSEPENNFRITNVPSVGLPRLRQRGKRGRTPGRIQKYSQNDAGAHSGLVKVVAAWPFLPESLQHAILAIVALRNRGVQECKATRPT
jgi:hypothetical protein